MTATTLLIFVKAVGLMTGIAYVIMMLVYFQSGPKRKLDLLVSAGVLLAAVIHCKEFFQANPTSISSTLICLSLLLLSNLLFWSARRSHGRVKPSAVFSEAVPDAFITSGPYRIIRHPFYLSYILVFVVTAMFASQWWLFVITIVLFGIYNLAAIQEELLLSRHPRLGAKYAIYLRHSWRWCPFLW